MTSTEAPELTFPQISYSPYETHFNLSTLLYFGGAAIHRNKVEKIIASGELGPPIESRIPLIKKCHELLVGDIARGLRRASFLQRFCALRHMIKWCDENNLDISFHSIEENFLAWTEHLIFRMKVKRDLSEKTAYKMASETSFLLSRALNIELGLLRKTRMPVPKIQKKSLAGQAEKQNLEELFEFGNMLLDIVHALPSETINGKLPVEIRLRNGKSLTEWCGIRPPEKLKLLQEGANPWQRRVVQRKRDAWEADTSSRTRYSLINLRVEAELLIFISRTSMNLSQAFKLTRGKFRYQSDDDHVNVFRVYKNRRQGEAEFRIFKEYSKLFKMYLSWIDILFPAEEVRLFPFIYPHKIPRADKPPRFKAVIERCSRLGIRYFLPRVLRATRINWLLRRSGDPNLTAEMAQHTLETLFRVYERPSHQLAASEISRYHRIVEPSLSPAPGLCVSTQENPVPIANSPDSSPSPDCGNPAGCFFCSFHRDIDSEDYIWCLTSYRHCKQLEIDRYIPNEKFPTHPAMTVIDRITAKLKHIELSSEIRAAWVGEANSRIREGRFHPFFDGTIQLLELQS